MIIIPAILTDGLDDYKNKIALVNDSADWIQIDISDGQFVPHQTVQLQDLIVIQRQPKTEVHLMVNEPIEYLDNCARIGVQTVLFHFEAVTKSISHERVILTRTQSRGKNFLRDPSPTAQDDVVRIVNAARAKGLKVGLVLNPDSELDSALPYDKTLDVIQLMGVQPGFYGRPFIPETLVRLKTLRRLLKHAMLEVDGGVNLTNIAEVAATGVDRIVVGSAIFGSTDPKAVFKRLIDLTS